MAEWHCYTLAPLVRSRLLRCPAEHVSTKTAVQIRSHAQKFINKLERNKDSGSTKDGKQIADRNCTPLHLLLPTHELIRHT